MTSQDGIWNRVLKKAIAQGVKRISPHGMRHSFASNLMHGNISSEKIRIWLGHATLKMIHQNYGHLRAYDSDINNMGR
ncbi:MAG: tyrosine-type recombinase/integrase [Planctomycetes bacterium]|nr:tyrosine-type recombinase/integrase [Planctomycetota bacterium]